MRELDALRKTDVDRTCTGCIFDSLHALIVSGYAVVAITAIEVEGSCNELSRRRLFVRQMRDSKCLQALLRDPARGSTQCK